MTERQRTDLLNYLNNNKIKYTSGATRQKITVDLTVNELVKKKLIK